MEMTCQFRLGLADDAVTLAGTDDEGRPFRVTVDRVWAMNLAVELDDWLSGGR